MKSELEFENNDGQLSITYDDHEIWITCYTDGSYDYGTYTLNKSEVEEIIKFLQTWKSNNKN